MVMICNRQWDWPLLVGQNLGTWNKELGHHIGAVWKQLWEVKDVSKNTPVFFTETTKSVLGVMNNLRITYI